MKKRLPALLLFIGLSLLLYPALCAQHSQGAQRDILEGYRAAVSRLGSEECQRCLAAAEAGNDPSLLVIEESGIIGYVTIPKLRICLPLYPDTKEASLRSGAGLWEGGSLPLGGMGRHSVLAAHRGLPEDRLFRELDALEVGDRFSVTVPGRVLTYQVDQILVVLPQDVQALQPEAGLDLCTLLTCTPYGVNSHRLLVRGSRI